MEIIKTLQQQESGVVSLELFGDIQTFLHEEWRARLPRVLVEQLEYEELSWSAFSSAEGVLRFLGHDEKVGKQELEREDEWKAGASGAIWTDGRRIHCAGIAEDSAGKARASFVTFDKGIAYRIGVSLASNECPEIPDVFDFAPLEEGAIERAQETHHREQWPYVPIEESNVLEITPCMVRRTNNDTALIQVISSGTRGLGDFAFPIGSFQSVRTLSMKGNGTLEITADQESCSIFSYVGGDYWSISFPRFLDK